MANETDLADQSMTTATVANNPGRSVYAKNGHWLTKRRDGRSNFWMIARWQDRNRTVIYRSTRTGDLEEAKAKLDVAAITPTAEEPPSNCRQSPKVYFIQAQTGQIKIGIAQNCESRLAQIRTMSPVPIVLLAECEGGSAQEAKYHRTFAEHRLHGEWFDPHPDILAEIERLNG